MMKTFGYFSKENIQMTNKHIKRFSISLAIRELQTMSYHFIATRIAKMKK